MKSGHVIHLLSEFMDGALSQASEEKVKSHLIFCASCSETLREYEEQRSFLTGMEAPPPSASLEPRILSAVFQEVASMNAPAVKPPSFTFKMPRWGWGLAGAFAAAVMAFWVGDFSPYFQQAPEPASGPSAQMASVKLVQPPTPATEPKTAPQPPEEPAQHEKAEISVNPQKLALAPQKEETVHVASSYNRGEIQPTLQPRTPEIQVASVQTGFNKKPKLADNQELWSTSGVLSGIAVPQTLLITNSAEFENIWKIHTENVPSPTEAPNIDFSHRSIVAIFAGERPSAGYRVRLQSVENSNENGEELKIVNYQILEPIPGTLQATVMTQPFLFQEMPKTQEKIVFHENP